METYTIENIAEGTGTINFLETQKLAKVSNT